MHPMKNLDLLQHKDFLNTLQVILFSLIIFLIPTNLFLKYSTSSASVGGIVVDYLLPKLYLSDMFVLLLVALWCIEAARKSSLYKIIQSCIHNPLFLLWVLFSGIHLATHFSDFHILSTLWFLIKILELAIFTAWIIAHRKVFYHPMVYIALITTIFFQSVLGLYQYRAQHAFFGYWFLGEPQLENQMLLAKNKYSGAVQVLPYGTTPHPNVLAGMLVFYIFFLFTIKPPKTLSWTAMLCGFIVIALTQSSIALISILIGGILFLFEKMQRTMYRTFQPLILGIGVGLMFVIPMIILTIPTESLSVLRRQQLEQIAVRMFLNERFTMFGVGLNQFTAHMEEFGTVVSTVRFLQPVHEIPLLWLAETGLVGILFLILFIYFVHKKYSYKNKLFSHIFIPLVLISSLDHYLFSLQAGQLLCAVLFAFLIEKKEK